MPRTATTIDRAAAIRAGLRELVAERGFHGASMSEVATRAGVAVGTAYVHYTSKDDLVVATYLETKRDLGAAAVAAVDHACGARERFDQLWRGVYEHLREDADRARFLLQVESSPYAHDAHARALEDDDTLVEEASRHDLAALLAPLPSEVLFDLGIGPAVRLAAREHTLTGQDLDVVIEAAWRAITTPVGST